MLSKFTSSNLVNNDIMVLCTLQGIALFSREAIRRASTESHEYLKQSSLPFL